MAEDFDRSFDFFQKHGKAVYESKDIWNGNTTSKSTAGSISGTITSTLNSSGMLLDTANLDDTLEYSVVKATSVDDDHYDNNGETKEQHNNNTNKMTLLTTKMNKFEQDQVITSTTTSGKAQNDGIMTIRVAMHEQISAMYDDFSQEGAISLTGSIHMKVTDETLALRKPFCLVLKEVSTNIQKLEFSESILCEDISDYAHDKGLLYPSDRVLRISLNPNSNINDGEVTIAKYSCVTKLRPVPLLIKSRVRASQEYARVGFKIRANPTNENSMKNIIIMMAVPPDVDGEHVKTSRKGGSWEELKRTLCWSVDEIEPGKALEIQAQFNLLEGGAMNNRVPKFPVLVRCDYPSLFSSLELSNEYYDEQSIPIKIKLSTSARILHRKV